MKRCVQWTDSLSTTIHDFYIQKPAHEKPACNAINNDFEKKNITPSWHTHTHTHTKSLAWKDKQHPPLTPTPSLPQHHDEAHGAPPPPPPTGHRRGGQPKALAAPPPPASILRFAQLATVGSLVWRRRARPNVTHISVSTHGGNNNARVHTPAQRLEKA